MLARSRGSWGLVLALSSAGLGGLAALVWGWPLLALAAALPLGAAALHAERRTRRTQRALTALREASLAIGQGSAPARLESEETKELEALAAALDQMVGRLEARLERLDAQTAVAQQLLSSVDTGALVRTLLDRLPELQPCDFVSVTLRNRGERGGEQFLRVIGGSEAADAQLGAHVLRELRRIFRGSQDTLLVASGDPRIGSLAHPAQPAAGTLVALPLFFKRDLLGVVCLGMRVPPAGAELAQLRRLADHAAVALSNARMVEEIRFLAYYDELTGLPNRVLCTENLSHAIGRARRRESAVAVLLIDLDAFKRVNESLGQDVGDDLLRTVSERISASLRPDERAEADGDPVAGAIVCRLGGDEFVCILENLAEERVAAGVARRILDALARPFEHGAEQLVLGASIGVSIYPGDGEDVEALLRNAHAAMSHAKEEGRRDFRFYRGFMNEHASRRLNIENRLRKALADGDLELLYQPIIDTVRQEIAGAESLLRWTDPELGVVSPAEFVPIAEESGLIMALGEWTLRTALAQAADWRHAGLRPIGISVNVSGRQFRDRGLAEMIRNLVSGFGVDPTLVTLELTESILMKRTKETLATMGRLREAGLRLCIDDFGTGFSSLSYLKDLPLDALKVDRSFVLGLGSSPRDEAVVTAILVLGRELQLKVVAEGVERPEQLRFLQAQGCELFQGYVFSPAVSGEILAGHLRDGTLPGLPRGPG